jgi:dihydropteroate synthase
VGVLNVTPDSFSDGGRFVALDQALAHAEAMLEAGAHLLDIGGESTRPRGTTYGAGAHAVSVEEELRRVLPVVEQCVKRFGPVVSVDTSKATVAEAALDLGAEWINDVSALRADPRMASVVARAECGVVLMHMRGDPQTTSQLAQFTDVVAEVRAELSERLEHALACGVAPDRLVVDPGLGFGKGTAHNLELLRRQRELLTLGYPLLVGPSRKRFIGETLGGAPVEAREWGTAAAVTAAVLGGATFVRVHHVEAMRQVAQVALAIRGGSAVA